MLAIIKHENFNYGFEYKIIRSQQANSFSQS